MNNTGPEQTHELPAWSKRVSYALGGLICLAGIASLVAPTIAAQGFAVPPPSDPWWHMIAGSRELALGATLLYLAHENNRAGLRMFMFGFVVLPLLDCVQSLRAGSGLMAFSHAAGAVVMVVIGLSLKPTR